MIGPLLQIAVMVGLTHGFRALERRVGPRRSGLLMGLPSTTALALVSCGLEQGLDQATTASEACLVGLVAAMSLPLAYARAVAAGFRVGGATLLSVLGYVAVAGGLWWVPRVGPVASVTASALGLVVACHLAGRTSRVPGAVSETGRLGAGFWTLAGRTAVPVVYVGMIRSLRALAGTSWAGRFITFPGGSLALLMTTHMEAGPATACRTAVAMPAGGLGMLAFLAAFRFGSPAYGLALGTVAGYAAALSTLSAVELLGRRAGLIEQIRARRSLDRSCRRIVAWAGSLRIDAPAGRPARFLGGRVSPRRFSPGLEALAG